MKFSLTILAICAAVVSLMPTLDFCLCLLDCLPQVIAAATPNDGDWDLSDIDELEQDVEDAVLEITDENFGDKVFRGTYDSIMAEMQELKPELFDETVAPVENADITPFDNTLAKRGYNVSQISPKELRLDARS